MARTQDLLDHPVTRSVSGAALVAGTVVAVAVSLSALVAPLPATDMQQPLIVDDDPQLPSDEEPMDGWPTPVVTGDDIDDTTSADVPDEPVDGGTGTRTPPPSQDSPGTDPDDGLLDDLTDTVDDLVGDVTDTVDDVTDGADDVVDDVTDTVDDVTGTVDDTVDGVTDTLDDTVDGVTDVVEDGLGGVSETTDTAVGEITKTVDKTVSGATKTVDETTDEVTDAVDDAVDDLSGTVGDLLDTPSIGLP